MPAASTNMDYAARFGLYPALTGKGFPELLGLGLAGNDTVLGTGFANGENLQQNYVFGDDFSWLIGQHQLKFGLEFRALEEDQITQAGYGGNYTFSSEPDDGDLWGRQRLCHTGPRSNQRSNDPGIKSVLLSLEVWSGLRGGYLARPCPNSRWCTEFDTTWRLRNTKSSAIKASFSPMWPARSMAFPRQERLCFPDRMELRRLFGLSIMAASSRGSRLHSSLRSESSCVPVTLLFTSRCPVSPTAFILALSQAIKVQSAG